MDTYTFKIVLEDSGDEFSEQFNTKNEEEIEHFEESIKQIIEDGNWYVRSVKLIKVETELN